LYVPEVTACFTAATFCEFTTGALATASSIFCKARADSVKVTWSPVWAVVPADADSPWGFSVTALLLFEPLTGATGSDVEKPLILSVTEISWGA
jgi:hypothetical protein